MPDRLSAPRHQANCASRYRFDTKGLVHAAQELENDPPPVQPSTIPLKVIMRGMDKHIESKGMCSPWRSVILRVMKSATDRSAAARKAAAKRNRTAAANKAAATRKANATAKKRSESAVKAAATRKANAAAQKRSEAAKKANETRKRNAAVKAAGNRTENVTPVVTTPENVTPVGTTPGAAPKRI
jgi:hypothetical protein